jgi:hypothetical protein
MKNVAIFLTMMFIFIKPISGQKALNLIGVLKTTDLLSNTSYGLGLGYKQVLLNTSIFDAQVGGNILFNLNKKYSNSLRISSSIGLSKGGIEVDVEPGLNFFFPKKISLDNTRYHSFASDNALNISEPPLITNSQVSNLQADVRLGISKDFNYFKAGIGLTKIFNPKSPYSIDTRVSIPLWQKAYYCLPPKPLPPNATDLEELLFTLKNERCAIEKEKNEQQNTNKSLEFLIYRVECRDETKCDGFGEGIVDIDLWFVHLRDNIWSDAIKLTGIAILPNGQTQKISELDAGNDFDDGDKKIFRGGKSIWKTYLQNENIPKTYVVNLILNEIDGIDGVNEAVDGLHAFLSSGKSKEVISAGITKGFGVSSGTIADVLSEAATLGLGDLFKHINSSLKSDASLAEFSSIKLGSPWFTFDGDDYLTKTGVFYSAHQILTIDIDGGKYEVEVGWRINR